VLIVMVLAGGPLFLLSIWCAWTQWREGRGRWQRLIWVCGAFVLLEIAPLGVLIAWGALSPGRGTEWSLGVTLLLVWNVVALLTALGRPVRLTYRDGPLPLVEDETFLARVAELSARMGVPTPVVRMVTSLGGEQQALAFAGGLTAPSVVVTDGILHRLDAAERDAVVAHELAHHANGSIWWLVSVTTVANCGAIALDPLVPESVTVLLAFALRVGFYRLVSRYFEWDCDRRAAAVLGFRNCCSALRKIHAVHPLRNEGWLSVLIYATATHPSVIERLHWLWRAAPADDKPDVEWAVADYRRGRIAAILAGLLWSGLVAAAVVGSMVDGQSVWPSVVLGVLAAGVPLLPLLGTLEQLRRYRRRAPTGQWSRLAPLAVGAAGVGMFYAGSAFLPFEDGVDDWFTWLTLLIASAGLLGSLLLMLAGTPRHVAKLRNELLGALHDHDFAQAARLGLDNAGRMAKVPDFRHNTAVAIALAGDYPRGLAELRSNFRDHPKFVQSLLTQSAFCCEEGDYAQALDLARQATERLPGDPEPLTKEAWALRRLDRPMEAETAARRALEIDAGEAGPHLILAALAIDHADEQTARAELALAERLSPGSPFGRLVEAEAAARFDTPATAAETIERAVAAANANPFAFIDRQVEAFRQRLGPTFA
jgi:Zn-dependent protease with chaperone function/Flp pilus assembly protein TadD